MAAYVPAWYQCITGALCIRRQCFIDLLLRVFRADAVTLRRPARDGLIPQGQDPRRPVLISKIRVGVIHTGIQQRHQNAVSI